MKFLAIALLVITSIGCNSKVKNASDASKPFHFTESNFEEKALKSDDIVVVDFWAAWCGPCRMIAPSIEALAKKYAGEVLIGKLNVDEEGAIAQKYGIRNIPTILIIKDGEVVEKIVGGVSKEHIERQILKVKAASK